MITDPAADESRGGSVLVRIAAFFLLGVLAYVLSIGPAVWYGKRLTSEQQVVLQRIYAPLIWLARDTAYGWPIAVYAMWWEKLGRDQ